jgi:hypothetical protein
MTYAVRAARLQLVRWPYLLILPWGVVLSSWVVNWVIFAALQANDVHADSTGGLLSIYIAQLVVFAMLFTRGFPFAINLSMTRRAYYTGSWLVILGLAAINGILLTLLEVVEGATAGWGVDLPFFGISFMQAGSVVVQTLVYAGPFLLCGGIAAVYAMIGRRWGANGMFAATVLSLIVPGLLIALVTYQDWWVAVGDWVVDQSAGSLFALWPGLISVVCAVAGFAVARRVNF